MKDTFCTISYKGFYIQTCYDNHIEEIKAFGIIQGLRYEKQNFKSIRLAKLWITKTINKFYK